jgi:hypothetical protein
MSSTSCRRQCLRTPLHVSAETTTARVARARSARSAAPAQRLKPSVKSHSRSSYRAKWQAVGHFFRNLIGIWWKVRQRSVTTCSSCSSRPRSSGEPGHGRFRGLRPADARSSGERKSDPAGDGRADQETSAREDSRTGAGPTREARRTPSIPVEVATRVWNV